MVAAANISAISPSLFSCWPSKMAKWSPWRTVLKINHQVLPPLVILQFPHTHTLCELSNLSPKVPGQAVSLTWGKARSESHLNCLPTSLLFAQRHSSPNYFFLLRRKGSLHFLFYFQVKKQFVEDNYEIKHSMGGQQLDIFHFHPTCCSDVASPGNFSF